MTKSWQRHCAIGRPFLLTVSPFFLMWLWLGIFVHPAVFTPWRNSHYITPLDGMRLAAFGVIFPLAYLCLLQLSRVLYGKVNGISVIVCSSFAVLVTVALTPIP